MFPLPASTGEIQLGFWSLGTSFRILFIFILKGMRNCTTLLIIVGFDMCLRIRHVCYLLLMFAKLNNVLSDWNMVDEFLSIRNKHT